MYENIWDRLSLLFQIKLYKDRVEAFESGEKYIRNIGMPGILRMNQFCLTIIDRLSKMKQ